MKKTLIVIDMQNDFVSGVLGTPEAQAIVPNVKAKIKEYLKNGDEVIFTRDTHTDNYMTINEGKYLPVPHCIKGTDGWEIVSEIDVAECQHIDKLNFGYPDWNKNHTFESIELIGVCTDICVVSNALILKSQFPEIDIAVDSNCCAGVTPQAHNAALTTMRSCQIIIK